MSDAHCGSDRSRHRISTTAAHLTRVNVTSHRTVALLLGLNGSVRRDRGDDAVISADAHFVTRKDARSVLAPAVATSW